MIFADCTALTATGDTTETLIGEIKLSSKAKRIVGIWANAVSSATLTSGENPTGIFRLQSDSVDMSPSKWPLDNVVCLTSGIAGIPTHIIPVDIAVSGLATINAYVTMDQAMTGALKARVGVVYEG